VNIIDIVIIFIMAFCIIRGLMLGLINSVSSLVALIAGIFFSKRYFLVMSGLMKRVSIPDHSGIVSYIIVFFLFFIGFKILFLLIKKISSSSGLSSIDRTLGVFLGFSKGLLICTVIITSVQVILPQKSNVIVNSVILPYYNKIISKSGVMPKDFLKYFEKIS
jgi:membrane protein required for colicin V production